MCLLWCMLIFLKKFLCWENGVLHSRFHQDTYMLKHEGERLSKMFSPTANKLICSYTIFNKLVYTKQMNKPLRISKIWLENKS